MIANSEGEAFSMTTKKPYYEHAGITIWHGDCLEILPLLEPVDLIFTDPPYGHNNNNNDMIANREAIYGKGKKPKKVAESEYRPIANDGPEANEIFQKCLPYFAQLLKPGCCCCCCGGGGGPDPQFARWSLWLDKHIPFKQMVVWDKGPMGMGHHYRRSYETVLVAQKPGAACKWYDTTNKIENIIRPGAIKKIIPSAKQHPTIKPVALPGLFIDLHTESGDTVLDPFMGSGTTLVAAKQRYRRGIGIELEEKYCEMAARRLQQDMLSFGDF
jgi:site-specific DNA-methyltransferase (adenine-specific)